MNGILGIIVFVGVTLPLIMLAWPVIVAGWIIVGVAGLLAIIGTIILEWKK
jgi:hypothetical protein